MRVLMAAAGAALFVSACGGGSGEGETEVGNDLNALSADNIVSDENGMMTGTGGMDGNADTNAETENMVMNDLTTNTADTNLANGL